MKPDDFKLLADIVKQRSGLALSEDKVYLLESRLTPMARKMGLDGLDDLIGKIRTQRTEALLTSVTEAMTTNESFFYRDGKPFEIFTNLVLPHLLEHRAGMRSFKIWSAACSTGQEPYTLAMILKEHQAKLNGWRVDILGTDLSSEVLEKAKVGIYSQFEVQRGLPIQKLMNFFQETNQMWQIDAAIRAMVRYRPYNLLDSLTPLGSFDVIYCRNVLIYFDRDTKAQVLENMAKILNADGFLFLGAAETVMGLTEAFKTVPGQRGVYVKA